VRWNDAPHNLFINSFSTLGKLRSRMELHP
jgi:hypothetical protein